ncbi:MAG: tetratricopeptide repeat protein [Desulfosarcinaceae bacterium]
MPAPHPYPVIDDPPAFHQADRLYTQGRLEQALALYRQVSLENPHLSEPWSRMGLIHLQSARWAPAVECYRQALMRNESQPAVWYNLAQGLEEMGKPAQAETAYEKALALNPQYHEACYNLARLHLLQGSFEKARKLYQQCLEVRPGHAATYNNLGKAWEGMGMQFQAKACYEKAGSLNPNLGEAWFNLAELLARGKDPDQAIHFYNKAIEVQADPSAAWNNLGNLHQKLGNYRQAAGCYTKVVELNKNLAEAHYNLGSALRLMESYEAAMKHLALAVKLKPMYAEAWNNLALACKNIGELDRALACFNRAAECQPDLAEVRWNRSFIHLLKKDYIAAWNDFEWRFRMPNWKSIYPLRPRIPRWTGDPCPQHSILIHDEQGLGDTLQFVRYLPMVKARCDKTILETRPELVSLLQSAPGVDRIVIRPETEAKQVACDFHVPLMSLPGIFGTMAGTIPANVPYLNPDPVKCRRWAGRLPQGGLRIGLVWAGRPQHTNDHNRSCPLSLMLPLATIPGTRFISLQKGSASCQIQASTLVGQIEDLGGQLHDFSDTAAVVANLDLLITVDTAVAHLAGAMGKPVWVLIPFIADWRWAACGQNSPWYPSMRLFRQPRPKDWPSVMEEIRKNLLHFPGAEANLHTGETKPLSGLTESLKE